jgi:hypothetical protein
MPISARGGVSGVVSARRLNAPRSCFAARDGVRLSPSAPAEGGHVRLESSGMNPPGWSTPVAVARMLVAAGPAGPLGGPPRAERAATERRSPGSARRTAELAPQSRTARTSPRPPRLDSPRAPVRFRSSPCRGLPARAPLSHSGQWLAFASGMSPRGPPPHGAHPTPAGAHEPSKPPVTPRATQPSDHQPSNHRTRRRVARASSPAVGSSR